MKWDTLDKDQPKTLNSKFLDFGYILNEFTKIWGI